MSFNRDCVIWECEPGKFRMGAFLVAWVDHDGDPEWDVEYNYDEFEWVGPICYSIEDARKSWRGANPGGYGLFRRPDLTCDQYNKMAKAYGKSR